MDEIQILIQELEKEQADLERLIDEAIKDGEYLMAHFHAEAISYVNRKLQTLRNLDDKNFDSKRSAGYRIKQMEKQLAMDYQEALKDYLKREIQKEKDRLNQLNQKEKVRVGESKILVTHLEALIAGDLKRIRITLKKSSNFILTLSTYRSGIKVEVPNLKTLRKNFTINEDELQHFFGLGFTLNENESGLMLRLTDHDKQKALTKLQTIISKIVFDIFYFKEFTGETFIEID